VAKLIHFKCGNSEFEPRAYNNVSVTIELHLQDEFTTYDLKVNLNGIIEKEQKKTQKELNFNTHTKNKKTILF
jgi:hypothetical protein